MNYCKFLKRQAETNLRPGANKRMETVFRPYICGDPHRDRSIPNELGTSLHAAREECKRRCPARFDETSGGAQGGE